MNWEIQFVFAVIAVAGVMFASGRVRFDIIASVVLLSLTIVGILTPEEAFAGFGNPLVVLVAGLLILGEILTRTGLAQSIGWWVYRVGGTVEWRVLVALMLSSALLGSVMSSTAVVAILIPVMVQLSRKSGLPVARLLLPLSYAALISGMMTLIATTPNLVVNATLQSDGFDGFHFFSITPIGVTVLFLGMLYMVFAGRHMLPAGEKISPRVAARSNKALRESFGIGQVGRQYHVPAGSLLVGLNISDSLISRFPARVLLLERSEVFGHNIIPLPNGETQLRAGDTLLLEVSAEDGDELARAAALEERAITAQNVREWEREGGSAVIMVHSESTLIGRSLGSANLRARFGVHVMAIRRKDEVLPVAPDSRLESGDVLLLAGGWQQIAELQASPHEFVLVGQPEELERYVPQRRKAPIVLAIVAVMVVLAALEVMPLVLAVLLAVGTGILTGCLSMDDAYRAIPWSTIVLIAGMLPVAEALHKTGGVELIVGILAGWFGGALPIVMMSALFFMSVCLGLFLANAAAAVLMAPVAIRAAEVVGVDPHAFAMTVAVAASAAFVVPLSTPAVTLIVKPGGYRMLDFVKLGAPLLIITWLVTVALAPLLFPFLP